MKIQFLRLSALAIIALFMAACSGMGGHQEEGAADTSSNDKAAFEQAYQQAESALKKVDAVEAAWSETEDRLAEAKEAAAKADYATALKLAERAKFESNMAYEQYESQKNAGPALF